MEGSTIRDRAVRLLPYLLVGGAYAVMMVLTLVQSHWRVAYWYDSWDQSQYLRSLAALSAGRLDASEHWYPLLYPLLEVPFHFLAPRSPFLLSGCVYLLIALAGFLRVAAHFEVERLPAALLFAGTTILYPAISVAWVVPWTTTLSAALIWSALGLALDEMARRDAGLSRAAVLGLLLAAIPLARPGDAPVAATIGAIVIAIVGLRDRRGRAVAAIVAAGLAAIALYGALHLAIYGPRLTVYMTSSAVYGLKLPWLPWKAYVLLVEPQPWFPDGPSLLAVCPWIPFGVAGLAVTIACRPDQRLAALTVGLPALAYAVTLLSYVDLLPSGMWRYGNIHYFKWLLPMFALFGLLFARGWLRHKRASAAALTVVLLAASIRLVPVGAAPDEPARALIFSAVQDRFNPIYMARSIIADRAGTMRNTIEYHQVPREGSVWAIAQKRDFAGGERWIMRAPQSIEWPAGTGARPSPATMAGERLPLHRYRVGWRIGLPCWLPPYPCALPGTTPIP
jgi:hypothetical protein